MGLRGEKKEQALGSSFPLWVWALVELRPWPGRAACRPTPPSPARALSGPSGPPRQPGPAAPVPGPLFSRAPSHGPPATPHLPGPSIAPPRSPISPGNGACDLPKPPFFATPHSLASDQPEPRSSLLHRLDSATRVPACSGPPRAPPDSIIAVGQGGRSLAHPFSGPMPANDAPHLDPRNTRDRIATGVKKGSRDISMDSGLRAIVCERQL